MRRRLIFNEGVLRSAFMEMYKKQGLFKSEEAERFIKECVDTVVGSCSYNPTDVSKWTSSIVENCLNHLVKQAKPFKYIVTCIVMQKSGAGLHTANSCHWDSQVDGSCTVKWENNTIYCVVSVFAIA